MTSCILTEFIEIYINQVIYLRSLYPRQIFKKHKAYALPVYCSIYPPLNEYLKQSLSSVEELINRSELDKVEILIYNDIQKESFVIDNIKGFTVEQDLASINEVFEQFRRTFYELERCCKSLRKFSRSSKFKILLHTNERSYKSLYSESKYQNFLWIKEEREVEAFNAEIVPITSSTLLSLYVKQF